MKVSRRNFLIGTASALTARSANAGFHLLHGNGLGASTNNSRVTINVPLGGYMNLAKSASFALPLANANSNGFPNGTLSSSVGNTNSIFLSNFYGMYLWSWTQSGGTGGMAIQGFPAIVYSGPIISATDGNLGIFGQVNPTATFKFGALVASVSASGGVVTATTTSSLLFGAGLSTGTQIKFNIGCSANLIAGDPSRTDGTWIITNVDGTHFTLNNSSGVTSPTVTGSGGAGVQTEALINASPSLLWSSGSFTGVGNLVLANAVNATDIATGLAYDPVFVNEIKALTGNAIRNNPAILRGMDISGTQGNFEADFSQRVTLASASWGSSNFPLAYQAGTITRSSGDLYTLTTNPPNSPASGPPVDCEIIQGTPSATNTGGSPTLTGPRSGFGTWPIIDGRNPFIFRFSAAPASAGLSMVFTFTASWLNGGTPYVFTYHTVAGDVGSISTLNFNIQQALLTDTTIAPAIQNNVTNSAQLVLLPRTPLAGALTITYTSGPAICTIVQIDVGGILASGGTFVFNKVLGGFVYINAGLFQAVPFETVVELCNRTGSHCWWNWPIYTKGQYITDSTSFFGDATTGLTPGLKFMNEVGNEWWNAVAQIFTRAQAFGCAMNNPVSSFQAVYSWQAAQTIQYGALSRAAWAAKGRAASDYYLLIMGQVGEQIGGNLDQFLMQTKGLTTTNLVYASFGGLGATAGADHTVSGSQGADLYDADGFAPYWNSPWWCYNAQFPGSNPVIGVQGPITENVPWLQAAKDYANGLTTTAFTSLANQFNGTTIRTSGTSNGLTFANYTTSFTHDEALVAQYDARRVAAGKAKLGILHYEGGPQWAMGYDFNNGINAVDNKPANLNSLDVQALAARMGAGATVGSFFFAGLNWDVSPYTISGTNNPTEMATMVLVMAMGWKYDIDVNQNPANSGTYKTVIKAGYYQNFINISGANRECRPAQYGYAGSQWGFYWSQNFLAGAGTPYQNDTAIAEWNA